MFNTSTRTLKLLASWVWYSGFIILFFKSGQLLLEAESINPGQLSTWLAFIAGIIIGAIKAKYLYNKLCIKNLRRIDSLAQPMLWHFYRARFFVFLCTMIIAGHFLSSMAQGNYTMLVSMAVVELSVATALLGSSYCFWLTPVNQKN